MIRLVLKLILMLALTGCSTIGGWFGGGDDQEEVVMAEDSDDEDVVRPKANRELELKLAKLWAKVDELELKQSQQHQKIRVLEKGLMLGIIPEELKNPAEVAVKDQPIKDNRSAPMLIDKPGNMAAPPTLDDPMNKKMAAGNPAPDREELIRNAQTAFENGRYGQAIAYYSQLKNEPGNSQEYWIGLCWFRLKEYETSHKVFTNFVNTNPDSPWIARAKYNLARVEYELGYRERAVKQMRAVINAYPEEDAAQMARASIQSWERSL